MVTGLVEDYIFRFRDLGEGSMVRVLGLAF